VLTAPKQRSARVRALGFRLARAVLYRVVVPCAMCSGPFEPWALRLFRLLLGERPPRMEGVPCPLQVGGLTLCYDADRPSNTIRGLAAGAYEQSIADLFARELHPGMTVLDIGAHVGYFTLMAAGHVGPTGHVWSFEPDPANRESLERNIDVNGMAARVSVLPLAVAGAVGESALYRMASDTGSSTLYPSREPDGGRVAVSTTSLDAWAGYHGWPAVDLVKLDAEGAEGAIVAGMTELVSRNPGIVVVLELQADALEAAGEDPLGFLRALVRMSWERIEVLDDRGGRRPIKDDRLIELVRRSRWSPLNLALSRAPRGPG
jgi:FkbM family methyltransferase